MTIPIPFHIIFPLFLFLLFPLINPLSLPSTESLIPVPEHANRFNGVWRQLERIRTPSLRESHNRVLYSGVREGVSDGLGHGMCTLNADISTALRLGVTYTHRVAQYGSLVGRELVHELRGMNNGSIGQVAGLSESVGQVEGFFGWGVGEVPREAVQEAACPVKGDLKGDFGRCKLCFGGRGVGVGGLRVDRVVEVPMELSYRWSSRVTEGSNRSLEEFLKRNQGDNVVFHMPRAVCDRSPSYAKFDRRSRSWFWRKYWDAHGGFGNRKRVERLTLAGSVKVYRESWMGSLRIPGVRKRGMLERLKEHELTVAVHARRGDFFRVGRPMVETKEFVRVLRSVMKIVRAQKDVFSHMPVVINFYSEGIPLYGVGENVGHDMKRLRNEFHDANGRAMKASEVTRMLKTGMGDGLGDVFANGVRVELRVSEDTVLCLHEMVASDIFVGSMSGMSLHLVGTLSRGAMQILPARAEDPEEWYGHVKFEKGGGIVEKEMELLKGYWEIYTKANRASAERAVKEFNRAGGKIKS